MEESKAQALLDTLSENQQGRTGLGGGGGRGGQYSWANTNTNTDTGNLNKKYKKKSKGNDKNDDDKDNNNDLPPNALYAIFVREGMLYDPAAVAAAAASALATKGSRVAMQNHILNFPPWISHMTP